MYLQIVLVRSRLLRGPPFGKGLLKRLTVFSLCLMYICNFSYFPFWFRGQDWVLITQVFGHCFLVTFKLVEHITTWSLLLKAFKELKKAI